MPMEFWPHIHKSFYVPFSFFWMFRECVSHACPWRTSRHCEQENCTKYLHPGNGFVHVKQEEIIVLGNSTNVDDENTCAIVYKIASTIARLWWTNSHCHATHWKPVITQLQMNPNWGLMLGFTLLIHLFLIHPCSVLDFCYEDGIWKENRN